MTTDPQTPPRDRLFALIAAIPGSGTVDWCDETRALLDEIAAPAVSSPLPDQTLRDRLVAAIKASPFDELRTVDYAPNGPLLIKVKVDDLADTLMRRLPAVLPPPADRAAVLLEAAEVSARFVSDCQTCAVELEVARELRRLAAEAQQPEVPSRDGAGEPAELRGLPREVRRLVHAVDRMRSDWAEAPEHGPERRDLWTEVHSACDAVWDRLDSNGAEAQQQAETETPTARVKHSGPHTKFCVLCLSGEHERVDEEE